MVVFGNIGETLQIVEKLIKNLGVVNMECNTEKKMKIKMTEKNIEQVNIFK